MTEAEHYDLGMLILAAEAHWREAGWRRRLAAVLFGRHIKVTHLGCRGRVAFWDKVPYLVTFAEALPDSLDDLNRRFVWTADGKLDRWHFLRGPGSLAGDCDDYAATALRLEAGSLWRWWLWVLTAQAVFWLCRDASGQMHLCVWRRGRGWIDNQFPAWGEPARHRRLFPVLPPVVALKLLLGVFR